MYPSRISVTMIIKKNTTEKRVRPLAIKYKKMGRRNSLKSERKFGMLIIFFFFPLKHDIKYLVYVVYKIKFKILFYMIGDVF